MKLKRGEGNLEGVGSVVRARRRRAQLPQFPQQDSSPVAVEDSVSMSHEGGIDNMSEDEKDFKKALLDIIEMVKVFYEERNTRLVKAQGLQEERVLHEEEVMEMVISHHLLHHHPHHHIHLHLHPLPLLQPLLIPQKELVNKPC